MPAATPAWWDGLAEPASDAAQLQRLQALHTAVAAAASVGGIRLSSEPQAVDTSSRTLLAALVQRRPVAATSGTVPATTVAKVPVAAKSAMAGAAAAGRSAPRAGEGSAATERLEWAWHEADADGPAATGDNRDALGSQVLSNWPASSAAASSSGERVWLCLRPCCALEPCWSQQSAIPDSLLVYVCARRRLRRGAHPAYICAIDRCDRWWGRWDHTGPQR